MIDPRLCDRQSVLQVPVQIRFLDEQLIKDRIDLAQSQLKLQEHG